MALPKRPPTGPGGYELSTAHKQVLNKNRVFLVQKLDPYSVMDPLIRRKIFAQGDRDLVCNIPAREDAVRNLLNMLTRRGPNALAAFIASSFETRQLEVANKLMAEAPDVEVDVPDDSKQRSGMETVWCPQDEFPDIAVPLRILKFRPMTEVATRPPLCVPTLIVSFAEYKKGTGRRPLTQNPILIEKLEKTLQANPCFETLPSIEDWNANDVYEGVQFFADNCYDADAAVVFVFGYASADLQHIYSCDNELVPIKNTLLDPIVNAGTLFEKTKFFIFCFSVEDALRGDYRKFTYGFASDDVKIFLPRRDHENDFISPLCRRLRSDNTGEVSSLVQLEKFCRERCERL